MSDLLFDAGFYDLKMNSNSSTRMEIPLGEYEAKLIDVNLRASKSGKPMITIQFEIMGAYNEANNKVVHQYHWDNIVVLNSKEPSDKKNRFFFDRAVDALMDLGYTDPIEDLRDVSDAVDAIKQSIKLKDAYYEIEISEERGFKSTHIGVKLED